MKFFTITFLIVLAIIIVIVVTSMSGNGEDNFISDSIDTISDNLSGESGGSSGGGENSNIMQDFKRFGLQTDTSKKRIDLEQVLSGGPGKDGIPAINDPKFVSSSQSKTSDETFGILVDIEGVQRFYPYSILVWHEIVNDSIGDTHFSATFCPLCGSGIVFDRRVDGEILQFGVSGLLFESNLLMYDTKTESLWSQARGEAVVGELSGTELSFLPMQLITFREAKEKYPSLQVLSQDTGYNRNYSRAPYSGYEDTEELFFPVSVSDKRLPAKEIMYVVPIKDGEKDLSISFVRKDLEDGEKIGQEVEGRNVIIRRDGDEIKVTVDGEPRAGYFEMWFSWATHHQEDGVVLSI